VSTDDLTSLSGLEDKHARALAKQPLQITTFHELASADTDAIYRAMYRFQPRPEPEDIASWQDQAQSKLSAPVMEASDWQRVASFAVVFWRRQVDGDWKRKLEVERTEVEPPMPPFVESSWDCSPACDWMLEHLGQDDGGDEQIPATPASGEDQARFPEKPGSTSKPHGTRERLRIGSAAVIDATGQTDLVQAGEIAANPPTELVSPDRVIVTVTGAQPGHEVRAVARIRVHGEPEWNSADPVTTDRSGRAELNLAPVSIGEHDIKLLAWTPDATAYPASIPLPTMTIKPPASAP
jgi:hypothetical protein